MQDKTRQRQDKEKKREEKRREDKTRQDKEGKTRGNQDNIRQGEGKTTHENIRQGKRSQDNARQHKTKGYVLETVKALGPNVRPVKRKSCLVGANGFRRFSFPTRKNKRDKGQGRTRSLVLVLSSFVLSCLVLSCLVLSLSLPF
jgi:hypothetical protein